MPNASEISRQLDRVLGFFPRAEGKAAAVSATALGMLAFMISNLPTASLLTWHSVLVVPPFLTLGMCLWRCFHTVRPSLSGGTNSLVYFREISRMSASDYDEAVSNLSDEDFSRHCVEQIWRNSKILTAKFEAVDRAFWWLAVSIAPWIIAVSVLCLVYPSASSFLRH